MTEGGKDVRRFDKHTTDVQITHKEARDGGWQFTVRVEDQSGASTHEVTLDAEYWQKFVGKFSTPEELVTKSFAFLLEREPKESILTKFDMRDISRYFPEFEELMRG